MRTIPALLVCVGLASGPAGCMVDDLDVESADQELTATAKLEVQGAKIQGAKIQGAKIQGAKIQGAKIQGAKIQGAKIQGTSFEGLFLNDVTHNYEYRYYNAHLVWNGQSWTGPYRGGIVGITIPTTVDGGDGPLLRIVGVRRDTSTNSRADSTNGNSNADLIVVKAQLEQNGTVYNPCTGVGDGTSCEGFFIDGSWDDQENFTMGGGTTFVGYDGVAAKCLRWGYRYWESVPKPWGTVPLRELYAACVRAAKADICGDGMAGTKDGTVIDLFDNQQILYGALPESEPQFQIDNSGKYFHGAAYEGWYTGNGVLYLEHNRWERLDASYDPHCTPLLLTDMETKQVTWHQWEPSYALANSLFLVGVESTTWCPHSPKVASKLWGKGVVTHLEKDCNTCTQRVCSTAGYESCCVDGDDWNASCAALAQTLPDCDGM